VGSDRFHEKFTKKTVKHPPIVIVWDVSAGGEGVDWNFSTREKL
jgi:hypothetical protein